MSTSSLDTISSFDNINTNYLTIFQQNNLLKKYSANKYLLKKNGLGKKAVAVRQVVGRAKKRQLATLPVNTQKTTLKHCL